MKVRRLRVLWWEPAPQPKIGDALRTRRGTFYGILKVHTRNGRLIGLTVTRLAAAPEGCAVHGWDWSRPRKVSA